MLTLCPSGKTERQIRPMTSTSRLMICQRVAHHLDAGVRRGSPPLEVEIEPVWVRNANDHRPVGSRPDHVPDPPVPFLVRTSLVGLRVRDGCGSLGGRKVLRTLASS